MRPALTLWVFASAGLVPRPTHSRNLIMKYHCVFAMVTLIWSLDISARADTTTGLITHLSLDETNGLIAADAIGNGNDATLIDFAVNHSQWVKGRVGGGL